MSRRSGADAARCGPKAGTPVIVQVIARTNAQGRVVFSHRWEWADGWPGGKGRIHIPSRKGIEKATPIHFHLKDKTNPSRGLFFTDASNGAMWVQRGSCPTGKLSCDDPEIPTNKMQRSPHLLKVIDENSEECTLHYRLRFKGRVGRGVTYDPEIKNGGTNSL